MKVFTVAEMIAAEQAADQQGHPYAKMMEVAGHGVAAALIARNRAKQQRILLLIGPGNNGGDGLFAAYHLANAGAYVTVYLYKARDDANFQRVKAANLTIL